MTREESDSFSEIAIKALDPALHFIKDDAVSEKVVEKLRAGNLLSDVVDSWRADKTMTEQTLDRLILLQKLLGLTHGNWDVLQVVVTDQSVTTLHDVACKYGVDSTQKPAILGAEHFQFALFKAKPASVTLGSIHAGIRVIAERYRPIFKALLADFVESGLDMWTTTLPEFFRSWESTAKSTKTSIDDSRNWFGDLGTPDLFVQNRTGLIWEAFGKTPSEAMLDELASFQRLAPLVCRPSEIPILIGQSFDSAQSIAAFSRDKFVSVMVRTEISAERAASIFDAAVTVNVRNDKAWLKLLKIKEKDFRAVRATDDSNPTKGVSSGQKSTKHYNMTEIFDLQLNDTGEGYSITSLSAYFVELLRLLQSTRCPMGKPADYSMLKHLLLRRPDLEDLQLSYENDSVLVDYIDLANEVMESYITYLNQSSNAAPNFPAFNVTDAQTAGKQAHTNPEVYEKYLSRQMHPLTTSPYIYSLDMVRSLLKAINYSRKELLDLLRAPAYIASEYEIPLSNTDLKIGVDVAIERSSAAESLQLSTEDFLAITGESFWPEDIFRGIFRKSLSRYLEEKQPTYSIGSLWGYQASSRDESNALMTSDSGGECIGLTMIRTQFLERAGLSFEELLAMLDTEYIAGRLVITPKSKGLAFTGPISEMRLRMSILGNAEGDNRGKLTVRICDELQSFIRLRHRLGWSIPVLDKVITCIKKNGEDRGLVALTRSGISADLMVELAYIQRLSNMVGVAVDVLLPLWSDMETTSSDCLYARIASSHETRSLAVVSEEVATSETPKSMISYEQAILAFFNITHEEFCAILDASSLKATDQMNVATVSTVYRHVLLCRISKLNITQCIRFKKLFDPYKPVFESPQTTVEAMESLASLVGKDCNIDTLWSLVGASLRDSIEGTALEDRTKTVLLSVLSTIRATGGLEQHVVPNANIVTPENVMKMAIETFGQDLGEEIAKFINIVDTPPPPPSPPPPPPRAQTQVPSAGGEAASETQNNPLISKEAVVSRRLELKASIQTRLKRIGWSAEDGEALLEGGIEASKLQQQRAFISRVAQATQISFKLQETLRSNFPKAEIGLISAAFLAAAGVLKRDREPVNPAAAILKRLLRPKEKESVLEKAQLCTQKTDTWTFRVPDTLKDGTVPRLTVNGLECTLSRNDKTSIGPIMLQGGQEYALAANFDIRTMQWMDSSGKAEHIPADQLITGTMANTFQKLCDASVIVLTIAQVFSLSYEEIQFLQFDDGTTIFDVTALNLRKLLYLRRYQRLGSLIVTPRKALLELLTWLRNRDEQESLTKKIAVAFGWTESLAKGIIAAKYPGMKDEDVVAELSDMSGLQGLLHIQGFLNRYRLSINNDSLTMLFSLAVPGKPFDEQVALKTASQFRDRVIPLLSASQVSNYHGRLQEHQRTALINYLLCHKEIQKLDIWNANQLFEYFLIDVQMGNELQTSRTKQAISTIQLYVQRCLLGLEDARSGIKPGDVPKQSWGWMQRFSLWEATRKLMYYPENWIDPLLRDNKSEVFQEFETVLLSGDMNMDTFASALSGYVKGLHEISDLSVQGYFGSRDMLLPGSPDATKPERKSITTAYHFIASTRDMPYQHFYRKMDLLAPPEGPVLWSPWCKIEAAIDRYTSDWNAATLSEPGVYLIPIIRNNRLYLLTPRLIAQAVENPKAIPQGKTAAEMANSEKVSAGQPSKVWELKMEWTECVKGKWHPKKTSSSTLTIPGREVNGLPNQLPSVANFHFFVDSESDPNLNGFSICAGCWYADKQYLSLGKFWLVDDQIMFPSNSDFKELGRKEPLPTVFNKIIGTQNDVKDHFYSTADKRFQYGTLALARPPLVAIPRGADVETKKPRSPEEETKKAWKAQWTLTFDPDEPEKSKMLAGLVYDVIKEPQARSKARFTYIKRGFDKETVSERLVVDGINESLDFVDFSSTLKRAVTQRDPVAAVLAAISGLEAKQRTETFGYRNAGWHELSTPYAQYTWEIGVHCAMLAMERLLATQQFEAALSVAHLIFDPTQAGLTSADCWKFPPFKEISGTSLSQRVQEMNTQNTQDVLGLGSGLGIGGTHANPSAAHVSARGQPVAYMKRVMMKYVEILLALGDQYFRQATLESLPLAIQRYVEALQILGPEPPKVPNIGKRKVQTFKTLEQDGKVDMELAFPFSGELLENSRLKQEDAANGYQCVLRTTYFSVPPNPQFLALRATVNIRLYNLRHSLDINGKPMKYALLEPPIDPGMIASLGGDFSQASMLLGDLDSPMPNYRFIYLLGRVQEMCSELKAFGDQFLAIKEKRDAEHMALLSAGHNRALQNALINLKDSSSEINKEKETLLQQRESLVMQLDYHLALLGEPFSLIPKEKEEWMDLKQSFMNIDSDDLRLTPFDKKEMETTEQAQRLQEAAGALDLVAAIFLTYPSLSTNIEPFGVGMSVGADASIVGKALGVVSAGIRYRADGLTFQGSRALRTLELRQQLQERRLQANTTGREIKNIDKQVQLQDIRLEANREEVEVQKMQAEDAATVEEWCKSKFTNEQLYIWMENSLREQHFRAYNITMDLAKRAELAYRFETNDASAKFLKREGYWDGARGGIFAGQGLMLDLKKMELAYQDTRGHDYEISKTVSLRSINPLALMDLRHKGLAKFSLPETLFDMDFPGHYMRRIKSVSVSIPCIVGPYTSVNASLTLMSHDYRVSALTTAGDEYPRKAPRDDRFRFDRIPLSSIAVSTAQQDSGVFELDFKGERFMPFEGAGVLSTWQLELPTEMRQFDYESISDVILHLRYTSLDGGVAFKNAAVEALRKFNQATERSECAMLIDLRNDFPNQWGAVQNALQAKAPQKETTVKLDRLQLLMPYWARGKKPVARKVTIIASPHRADWNEKLVLTDGKWRSTFSPPQDLSNEACSSASMLSSICTGSDTISSWSITLKGVKVDDEISLTRLAMVIEYVFSK